MESIKYKIAVVEDVLEDKDILFSFLKRYEKEKGTSIDFKWFNSPIDFLEITDGQFDIVFMDINLPMLNGLETAKRMREKDDETLIIFLTSLAQYAIQSYEVGAIDYILKPINYYDFALKFEKAIQKASKKVRERMLINTHGTKRIINISDIVYVEVIGHRIKYHMINEIIETRDTLKNIESVLKDKGFALCNSCYLVNLKHVESVKKYECQVRGETIFISQPKKKKFIESLLNYVNR